MARTLTDQPRLPRSLRKRKQGIVLLMVVSLLALFLLMGVTFAVLAMQYNSAARMHALDERYGDDPMMEADLAFGQVLYDSSNRSSLAGHSLLRDLYGTDYVRGTVQNNALLTTDPKTLNGHFTVFATTSSLSTTPGFFNGRVITFITGSAAGFSSRIAGYEPQDSVSNLPELYIEPIRGDSGNLLTPSNNDEFVINGQPFNGMGFGYDTTTYRLDAVDNPSATTPRAVALLPHFAGYPQATANSPDIGGADEPWDAGDLQNPHLAVVPPGLIAAHTGNNRFSVPLIPSFVRPELINYWLESTRWPGGSTIALSNIPANQEQRDLARQIIFRPMPWDHPNFTGSNPDLTPTANSDPAYAAIIRKMAQQTAMQDLTSGTGYWEAIWDVDNDGDGVRESVWVDVGLPVMTSPSGRRYKRLFAFLIKDLDGRVQLNVHGNGAQLITENIASSDVPYPFPVFGNGALPATASFPNNNRGGDIGAAPTASVKLPRGMGFGPAEVDFRYVLSQNPAINSSLNSIYANVLANRYGGDNAPGISGTDDPLNVLRMSGVPGYFVSMESWYGSPPDVWGRSTVAIDYGGRPFFYRGRLNPLTGFSTAPETWDDPYEMEWDPNTAISDQPFTVQDMEKLLRNNDSDAGVLGGQLQAVASDLFTGAGQPDLNGGANHRARESISTMGSYIPTVPAIYRPDDRVLHGTNAPTIVSLYVQKLQQGGFTGTGPALKAELAKIMPWEFWQGSPLNINRYLGNGVNDNSGTNRAIDEREEALANETAWGTNSSTTQSSAPSGGALPSTGGFNGQRAFPVNSVDVDRDNQQDGVSGPTNDRGYARHLLARHLYCLAMALKGNSYNPPKPNGVPMTQQETARLIAQWAVNVVDFRDPDGIMTGFEYDTNPWDGWSVDGNLSTVETAQRGLVWGSEAQELLLTEAFAMHDRRIRDTSHDNGSQKKVEEPMNPDDDPDQFRVPQGSLFFELYCPRTHTMYNQPAGSAEAMYSPQMPFELYDKNTGKLDLARVTPGTGATGRQHPVWQVAVSSILPPTAPNTVNGLPHNQIATAAQWDRAAYADPTTIPNIVNQAKYDLQFDSANAGTTVEIERYIWFTNSDGGAANPKQNRIFYNHRNWSAQVSPGQYMVVGPREKTVIGSNNKEVGRTVGDWFGPSLQEINLNSTTGVAVTDAMGNTTSKATTPGSGDVQPVAALVVDTRPPDAWATAAQPNRRVGANVTEPLPNVPALGPYYREYNNGATPWTNPFDSYDDPNNYTNTLPNVPEDTGKILDNADMLRTQTYSNKVGLFLQRLADPTQDWDPLTNPYITVDFAPVDVSVFSGEEDTGREVDHGTPNVRRSLDLEDPWDAMARISKLYSGQRGVAKGNPWFPTFTETTATNPAPQPSLDRFMRYGLSHTLGYINVAMGTPRTTAQSGNYGGYAGDPSDADKPFPWIPWLNRPFMSPAELLMVPTFAPNRMVLEVTPDNPYIAAGPNPYATTAADFYGSFGYLLNMFQSSQTDNTALNLSRLFDFIEVPTNFVKTERWYSPNAVSGTDSGASPRPEYLPPFLYRPPFNRMSRFRDPGRININTIYDESVWNSIIGYDPNSTGGAVLPTLRVPFLEVMQSRQATGGNLGQVSQTYPTIFANPFRPANASDLMPSVANMRKSPVEAGFLRPSTSRTGEPLLSYKSASPPINTDRNPYFRYAGLQKLSNILSTQSNCYAVWVTTGYFEVEDTTPTAAIPDGFMLGQELGIDTGEVQRHRAFYLIDRSIPVGFIPGLKLNTDNCVLLRRQID